MILINWLAINLFDLLKHKQRNEWEWNAKECHQHIAQCQISDEIIGHSLHSWGRTDDKADNSISKDGYQENRYVHKVEGRLKFGTEPSWFTIVGNAAHFVIQSVIRRLIWSNIPINRMHGLALNACIFHEMLQIWVVQCDVWVLCGIMARIMVKCWVPLLRFRAIQKHIFCLGMHCHHAYI